MGATETIEFYGEIKHRTMSAILVHDGINAVWIPQSQIKSMRRMPGHDQGNDYEFRIPYWLAKKKQII